MQEGEEDGPAQVGASPKELEEFARIFADLSSPAFLEAVSAVPFNPADFEKDEGNCLTLFYQFRLIFDFRLSTSVRLH